MTRSDGDRHLADDNKSIVTTAAQLHREGGRNVQRPNSTQLAEGRCGYGGSNKPVSVERDSLRKNTVARNTPGERWYQRLLRLYPRDFRDEFGGEMTRLYRDRGREEPRWSLWCSLVVVSRGPHRRNI